MRISQSTPLPRSTGPAADVFIAVSLGRIPTPFVRARKILNIYLNENISDYNLKLYAISHSIYGVDIDPGAVEIAKLRLWLALIVDEKTPSPLPNLDHKIMQGNSLISEYEGIKLFDDSILDSNILSFEEEKKNINKKISLLQREYFELHGKGKLSLLRKTEIENQIKSYQKNLKSFSENNDAIEEDNSLFEIPKKKKIAQDKALVL